MEAIRKGNCLRKVNKDNVDTSKGQAVEKPTDDLGKALRDRIHKLNLSDSDTDDDEYSSDSDEWDD